MVVQRMVDRVRGMEEGHRTLTLLCLTYTGLVINRNYLDVVIPYLEQDPNIKFGHGDVGFLLAFGNICGMVGKLLSGPSSDRFGGYWVLLGSGVFTGLSTVGFCMTSNSVIMVGSVGWGRFWEAAGWAASTKLISSWYHERQAGTAFGLLAFSSRMGMLLTYVIIGGLTGAGMPWREVLLVCSSFLLCVAVLDGLLVRDSPESPTGWDKLLAIGNSRRERQPIFSGESQGGYGTVAQSGYTPRGRDSAQIVGSIQEDSVIAVTQRRGFEKVKSEDKGDNDDEAAEQAAQESCARTWIMAVKRFLSSSQAWFILTGYCSLTIVMEIVSFVPLYLTSRDYKLNASDASVITAFFSLGAIMSTVTGGFIYDRLSMASRALFIAVYLMVLILMFMLWPLVTWGLGMMSLILLVIGFTVSTPYFIPSGWFSVVYGGPKYCSTYSTILDSVAFFCAILHNIAVGEILESMNDNHGWNFIFYCTMIFAIVAFVSYGVFGLVEWRKDKDSRGVQDQETPTPAL